MQTDNEIKDIIDGWIDNKINNVHTALPGKLLNIIQQQIELVLNQLEHIKQQIIENLHILLFIMCQYSFQ